MGLLAPFIPYLIFLAVGGGAVWWADSGWCNKACTRQKATVVELRAQIEASALAAFKQQERWSRVVTAEAERAKATAAQRAKADLRRRADDARRDPGGRAVAIPDSTRRLLNDAYAAATPAGPAAAPQAAAAPDASATVADWAAWGISMIAWGQECQARDLEWSIFYTRLQEVQQ